MSVFLLGHVAVAQTVGPSAAAAAGDAMVNAGTTSTTSLETGSVGATLGAPATATPPGPESVSAAVPAPLGNAPAEAASLATLTLAECITRALAQNFTLGIARFAQDQAKDDVVIAAAIDQPTLGVSSAKTQSRSPSTPFLDANGQPVANPGSRNDGITSSLSLSQKLTTGATVTASTDLTRSERTPGSSSALNPAFTQGVNLTVRQPLLKGAGRAYHNAARARANLGLTRAAEDFKDEVLSVIRDVEAAYYRLAFARGQAEVRRSNVKLTDQLLAENRIRRSSGVATDLDVLQAEVGVANARRDELLAGQTVRDREDGLLSLIGRFAYDTPVGELALGADPRTDDLSLAASFARALQQQPTLAASQALLGQLRLDRDTARQDKKPSLSVGAGGGYNSREGNFGDAAREVWSGDGYSWQVDFALSVPWGLHAEKARYRQALSNLTREELRLQQLQQTLLAQVRAAVRGLQTSAENLRLSVLSRELSQKEYDFEKARYDAGLSTFRRVQESRQDLATARVNELQAQVDLRIARAELDRLEARSLERYRVDVVP